MGLDERMDGETVVGGKWFTEEVCDECLQGAAGVTGCEEGR